MPYWTCKCLRKTYSASYARGEKTIKCAYCGKEIENPFYVGSDKEDEKNKVDKAHSE